MGIKVEIRISPFIFFSRFLLGGVEVLVSRVVRLWVYFKRAHNVYFVYALSFFNFITITYSLLLVPFFHFPKDPVWFVAYGIVFSVAYMTSCVLLGRWDFRKGTVPTEVALSTRVNPWVRDLSKAIILLSEGRKEEARKLLERWAGT